MNNFCFSPLNTRELLIHLSDYLFALFLCLNSPDLEPNLKDHILNDSQVVYELTQNMLAVCVSLRRSVTEMHVILYRGNNQLNVLEMPPEDCIDCLREYPCYPQIPPLSAGHSAAGLGSFVLFWFKPVSQARLSRSGAWNAFFCLHLLSWLHLKKKKLYEGVVESFAHYNLSDLTLEMKLNVAGISLPPIVLMLTFVSWSVLFSSWLGFCSIDGHLFSDSLQVYKSLIMRNRSSFQQGKGQQRIYYCPCCCHFQYHNDLIPLPYLSVLLKPHMHGFL